MLVWIRFIYELYTKLPRSLKNYIIFCYVCYKAGSICFRFVFFSFFFCSYKSHMLLTNTITFFFIYALWNEKHVSFLPFFLPVLYIIHSYIKLRIHVRLLVFFFFLCCCFLFTLKESESLISLTMAEFWMKLFHKNFVWVYN